MRKIIVVNLPMNMDQLFNNLSELSPQAVKVYIAIYKYHHIPEINMNMLENETGFAHTSIYRLIKELVAYGVISPLEYKNEVCFECRI